LFFPVFRYTLAIFGINYQNYYDAWENKLNQYPKLSVFSAIISLYFFVMVISLPFLCGLNYGVTSDWTNFRFYHFAQAFSLLALLYWVLLFIIRSFDFVIKCIFCLSGPSIILIEYLFYNKRPTKFELFIFILPFCLLFIYFVFDEIVKKKSKK
jgi:hypothetical protein